MQTLSLTAVILININIMLGAGLFINTTELAHRAGALSWLAYGLVGFLMLPLILSIAQLVRMYPQDGFYGYATKEFNPLVGFVSTWTYFISKLASATLTAHAAATLMYALVPALQIVKPVCISASILLLFGLLNLYNIRTGSMIQRFFIIAKIILISFVVLAGFMWFNPAHMTSIHMLWEGLPSCAPLVLFATLGFEAACSLSSKIENPSVNGPRAIIISFLSVIGVYCIYQFFAYNMMGESMYQLTGYQDFFASLATMISPAMSQKIVGLLYCALAASTLGGTYGILYSNMWNIHTLARHNHIAYAGTLMRLNRHAIPMGCVMAEVAICLTYLWVSSGMPLPLQQIAAMGSSFTYFISVCALVAAKKKRFVDFSWVIVLCGLINCFMLAALCVVYVLRGGHATLYVFAGLFIMGISMFLATKKASDYNPKP